jgi:hypothetical protein
MRDELKSLTSDFTLKYKHIRMEISDHDLFKDKFEDLKKVI